MHRIAIVGAGQAGLTLAAGLLQEGYDVTVLSNRTPSDIRHGKITSTQCMFDSSLRIERDFHLDEWNICDAPIHGIGISLQSPDNRDTPETSFQALLEHPAHAVDQRMKMSSWLEQIESKGGHVIIKDVGITELESLADQHDLTLLATGRGEAAGLLERCDSRSAFTQPQRNIGVAYVHGMTPLPEFPRVNIVIVPGVGEYFSIPVLTLTGPCDVIGFEAVPGGPWDIFRDITDPKEHLRSSMQLLKKWIPSEADRGRHIELTDDKAVLVGAVCPVVRRPVITLPSRRSVFGVGDAVIVNDPIVGQGANNAAKAAKHYFEAITEHGDKPFTPDWMKETFEQFWNYAQWSVQWCNSLLAPPEPHILSLMHTAAHSPNVASAIVNGFDDPSTLFPWWTNAAACKDFESKHAVSE